MQPAPVPTAPVGLTQRQAEALAAIRRLTAERGYAPSLEEIAGAMGVSRPRAWAIVRALVERGAASFAKGRQRTISAVDPAAPATATALEGHTHD